MLKALGYRRPQQHGQWTLHWSLEEPLTCTAQESHMNNNTTLAVVIMYCIYITVTHDYDL